MSKVARHLSLPSLYGYRLAIGYFRVVKGGVQSFPRFASEFGGSWSVTPFWGFSSRSRLELVGRPEGKTTATVPRVAKQTPGYVMELKPFGVGNLKFSFGSCVSAYRTPA
jgi:hypothetical protein